MKLLALSGGIASGKSTVAKMFEELGAKIIDADQLARDAVLPYTPALKQIRETFGDGVISPNGELDRAALASVVFNSSERLKQLNAIVHPAVRELFDERLQEIESSDSEAIAIYDVPLLVESLEGSTWDGIIVAHAPEDVRFERLINLRGMTRDDAKKRIANQASDDARLAIADHVVDTSTSLEKTRLQVLKIWNLINS